MTRPAEPKSEALRVLYWREEILQVMFWIEGEGLGDDIDPETLTRFLNVDPDHARAYLDRLVADAYLESAGSGRYRLSEEGKKEGGRLFSEEFAELTRPAHGECGSDCWCHVSVDEAEACRTDRGLTPGVVE